MTPVDFFADHTFAMVFFGTSFIGLVAGALGSFAYLRGQSLVSDVISHAALPGSLVGFLLAAWLGGDGRLMPALVAGALVLGTLAVLAANHVAATSRVRPDTAMAVTLAVSFGVGMLLMRLISDGDLPGKGGIQDHVFGDATTMTWADLVTVLVVGGVALLVLALCWKEFALQTFDRAHAFVLGFRPRTVDGVMFGTIVIATVIGLKAVGLVLMVALVVTPPAAARQWVSTLPAMVGLSAVIGAVASGAGSYLSVVLGDVPPGPLVVLVLFGVFAVSLLAAPRRSIIGTAVSRARLRRALAGERP